MPTIPRILTTTALCLAAGILLNSCMISNIGGTIRDMGEEKTAVDTNNPVGGVVYRKNSTYDSQVIMQAPEVVYRGRDGLIRDNKGGFCCFGCPEVKETGRTLWVQVDSTGAYTLLTAAPSHEWKKEEFSQRADDIEKRIEELKVSLDDIINATKENYNEQFSMFVTEAFNEYTQAINDYYSGKISKEDLQNKLKIN